MPKLAINGGEPIRKTPFPRYITLGEDEKHAVMEVLDGGVLSQFLGTWSPDFYGGPRIQKFEREWAAHFGVKHAITVNSATSGLYAAVGAAGISPGDEVIVSPYTMSASATAAIIYGGIPVFADIDKDIFCLSVNSVRERITPYTKAIVVVHIFGQPADMSGLMELAREHNLIVIEDNAQGPGAKYHNSYAGCLADMGVFSLNYHKHIHTGEGGVIVTNNDELAERLQLIRNHAEVVVRGKGVDNLVNMVGFNYRMTEIEAAIGSVQLKKLQKLVEERQSRASYLTGKLALLSGITPPVVRPDSTHAYYVYPIRYDELMTGVTRERFAEALRAEGIPVGLGYVRPIYLEPMYQKQIAFGRDGFPFTYSGYKGIVNYAPGICPVAEKMHFQEIICGDFCHAGLAFCDLDDIIAAFEKVFNNLDELQEKS